MTFDWKFLADVLVGVAWSAWSDGSCIPQSLNVGKPICLFVWYVLDFLGIKRSLSTVSRVRKSHAKGFFRNEYKTNILKSAS